MGKFDGVLIGTDWDGTLYCNGQISEKNIKAIKYFQSEGGSFTICSGRYFEFLKQFLDIIHPNTYTVCYNGALIIDMDTMEILHEGFCDEYVFEIIESIINGEIPYHVINVYDNISPIPIEYSPEEFKKNIKEIKSKNIYKVLLKTDLPENGYTGAVSANKLNLKDYIAVRSWEVSLEIMKKENAKGYALKRIAERIGARLTIGVGNYENDIELLKDADIGYAVSDAPDYIKAYADRITCSSEDSALAQIIYDLEKELN